MSVSCSQLYNEALDEHAEPKEHCILPTTYLIPNSWSRICPLPSNITIIVKTKTNPTLRQITSLSKTKRNQKVNTLQRLRKKQICQILQNRAHHEFKHNMYFFTQVLLADKDGQYLHWGLAILLNKRHEIPLYSRNCFFSVFSPGKAVTELRISKFMKSPSSSNTEITPNILIAAKIKFLNCSRAGLKPLLEDEEQKRLHLVAEKRALILSVQALGSLSTADPKPCKPRSRATVHKAQSNDPRMLHEWLNGY